MGGKRGEFAQKVNHNLFHDMTMLWYLENKTIQNLSNTQQDNKSQRQSGQVLYFAPLTKQALSKKKAPIFKTLHAHQ